MGMRMRRLVISACLVLACVLMRFVGWNPFQNVLTLNRGYSFTASADLPAEYVRIVGPANIECELEPGSVEYAPLDVLGRAVEARACVTWDMSEHGRAREREDMRNLEPSGWGNNGKAHIMLEDGSFYNGYFWNRSHLVAKSLGGDDIIENLVCGTRMQNVGSNKGEGHAGGMAYCETKARNWLEEHQDGFVYYVVRPVYEGSELVCRYVVVSMRSSDGELDEEVEVYNAARGYRINYATGEFEVEE